MDTAFQSPVPTLTGTITTNVVHDLGADPQTVIDSKDFFHVHVGWEVTGGMAPLLGGDWIVKVFYESIGSGPEGQLGPDTVVPVSAAAPVPLPRKYFTLTPNAKLPAGTYKLTTTITYKNAGIPQELAGFSEGPIIQVYDSAI